VTEVVTEFLSGLFLAPPDLVLIEHNVVHVLVAVNMYEAKGKEAPI